MRAYLSVKSCFFPLCSIVLLVVIGVFIHRFINMEFYFPAIKLGEKINVERSDVFQCNLSPSDPGYSRVMSFIRNNRRGWHRNFVSY